MANRTMQAKAMKLAKQRHAAPYQLNTRELSPDPIVRSERASTLRLAWAGDKIVRADDGARQQQLSCFKYDPATFVREVRLIPAR
jgi:hypothetical protein